MDNIKPSKHFPVSQRAPIESDNPAIMRFNTVCFHCTNCKLTCLDQAGVLDRYSLESTKDRAICIYCGQCAKECPTGAVSERRQEKEVAAIAAAGEKTLVASVSPAVRVSLAEAFGRPAAFTLGKVVSLLKKLGFAYVLDTTFGADLTVMEEAAELVERLKEGKRLPMFTSCCPSWVRFCELFYPEYVPNLSGTKSPVCMQGTMIKTAFAAQKGLDPQKICAVAVTPCTAKKYEITRPELNAAGKETGADIPQDTDYALTVREIARWAEQAGIDFDSLEDGEPDCFAGSGAGTIFGATGGVTEAALRTAYYLLNGENPPADFFALQPVRGSKAVREAEVDLGKAKLKVAVIFGTREAGEYLDGLKQKEEKPDFVEVMTCPGGCIGGGGQPKGFVISGLAVPEKRMGLLYRKDGEMPLRLSHENQEVRAMYQGVLGCPGSEKAQRLLHTAHFDASAELTGGAG